MSTSDRLPPNGLVKTLGSDSKQYQRRESLQSKHFLFRLQPTQSYLEMALW